MNIVLNALFRMIIFFIFRAFPRFFIGWFIGAIVGCFAIILIMPEEQSIRAVIVGISSVSTSLAYEMRGRSFR